MIAFVINIWLFCFGATNKELIQTQENMPFIDFDKDSFTLFDLSPLNLNCTNIKPVTVCGWALEAWKLSC